MRKINHVPLSSFSYLRQRLRLTENKDTTECCDIVVSISVIVRGIPDSNLSYDTSCFVKVFGIFLHLSARMQES
jgi:hypothetical protein